MVKLRINPFNTGNPLGLRDALIIAVISASATYTISFLANVTYGQVVTAPGEFLFDSIKTWAAAFFGSLITLGGLDQYIKRKEVKS